MRTPNITAERHRRMTVVLWQNAIVHNLPEQGTVQITTSATSDNGVLTIENTGQKLSAQQVATLAEPFQRGTNRIRADTTGAGAGVGLGLAIVKSITEAHDGARTARPLSQARDGAFVEQSGCNGSQETANAFSRTPRDYSPFFAIA